LRPEIAIRRAFDKIKNKALAITGRVSPDLFGAVMTDAGFLKRIWSSDYQFNNSDQLQECFRERKELELSIDSAKKKILSLWFTSIFSVFKESQRCQKNRDRPATSCKRTSLYSLAY